MKIARVFPTRTSMSPNDEDAYFGSPDLFTPDNYDEVHISVTFTWGLKKAAQLALDWQRYCKNVKVGGPAYGDCGNFVSGKYLKKGITITSRGCPKNCSYCFVPKREGKIKELPIVEGNIIQDNNLLACSQSHIDKVFNMLKKQKQICFKGGLDISLIRDDDVEKLRGLNIKEIWLAFDNSNMESFLIGAVNKLKKYFSRDKIRCYVLIGYENDTIQDAEYRLRRAYDIGTLPFAMRYRTPNPEWQGTYLFKERKWNLLAREWTRPAIMKSIMKEEK